MLGRELMRLVNDKLKVAGRYSYGFNATDLSSGIYFYRLETGEVSAARKMMMVR
jgi:hypothetical protein